LTAEKLQLDARIVLKVEKHAINVKDEKKKSAFISIFKSVCQLLFLSRKVKSTEHKIE